ncbi:hypothetical protein F511_23233 [Dorcoceras hygrometricum]|uniref:Myb/SANT-like DNA-binding domain-containing protein n=1 Tax=Dorcoceras hygrometricum TaxID=472368 RepID=A0A2Z7CH73_9LAMI|nr:hypothetical protein F511_23233 [Dorcoceras hygrometricum]
MSPSRTPSPALSSAASPISGDDKNVHSSPSSPAKPEPPHPATRTSVFPTREDCWSEDASRTLVEAWGSRYLVLNRGNLRQKHWQEVADAVNSVHGDSFKLRRTDVQCKNRIDTIKKKYKIEKSKVVQSNGRYSSTWPHFDSLDSLIGDTFVKTNNSNSNGHRRNLRRRVSQSPEASPSPPRLPGTLTLYRNISPDRIPHIVKDPEPGQLLRGPWSVPVGPRTKRSGPPSLTERNFSVMAAAAAAMKAKEEEEEDDEDSDDWGVRPPAVGIKRKGVTAVEGCLKLAEAIGRLGSIYERVEEAKQRQMLELEKQRMQFAKDLEIQRMKLFMVQLEKFKRVKSEQRFTW